MNRRSFIKKGEILGLLPFVPGTQHYTDSDEKLNNYSYLDSEVAPMISDRLDQGPFTT